MVSLIKHDLEFILKQIKIAEAHAAGGDLATLVAGYNGNDGFDQAHLLPYGLRTVDGSYNNLIQGRENWGAADQSFPGIFTPNYLNDGDGDRYDFGSHGDINNDGDITDPGEGPLYYTNNDYGNAGTRTGSQPGPGSGTVVDADPRIISNLIVDQTLNNPAAIAAALTHAGMSGQPLMAALSEINNAFTVFKAIPGPAEGDEPSNAYTIAKAALDAALADHGVQMDGNTVYLPNVSPDEGLSSPFNGWMTIFGQFFDHGLDLVAKGGNGTVYVPLAEDDPMYREGGQNYIPVTRVSVDAGPDGELGTADDIRSPTNLTTPWVDQNQTYGSTASKQVFMREYKFSVDTNNDGVMDARPIATGLLLEGSNGGLATWADIKAQAKNVLGIELTDHNVGNIPLIASDEYGNFIPGANGYPQLVVSIGLNGADDILREGNPAAPVSAQGVAVTGHAFLDDIAHAAVPVTIAHPVLDGDGNPVLGPNGRPLTQPPVLNQDTDSALGYRNADGSPGPQGQRGATAYDNELLDRHFIAGDGRVNENIALTAVHQVFHGEHNRLVEHTKEVALASLDRAFINEWLLDGHDITGAQWTTLTSGDATAVAALSGQLNWDGERLFQVGRFTNEMEYQHLVFEEFGRMMQPDIDVFLFEPSADINPSIAAEFAHVVYRFGHSMLRQDIAVIELDANGNPVQNNISLFDGFLNPVIYDSLGDAEAASGAIIRGMSRQTGSEIDEFVTDVLRNQLLGIPLDLATINIARGRDVGMPSLQTARKTFFDETGDTLLKPYESWADFALNLKNPASIINFIAAYGTHASVLNTQLSPKTVEELREAATKLVLGNPSLTGEAKAVFDADRLDFLNATGTYAGDAKLGGLNDIDFWMGGLAEKKMAFGGMLGSTFAFVFQMTMENLQDADRFYYLSRTQGLNLLNELENNTFAELVMRNTDLGDDESTALPGNVFSAFDMPQLEMDISKQLDADPVSDDPFLGGFSSLIERVDANGDGIAEYIRVNSNEHFVIGGTENDDTIVAGGGDDAIWGKGGNDRIEAGYGVDKVFGGEGDDIITNAGTDIGEADFLHGNEGDDVIHGGSGLSLLFGNQGNDFIVTGPDGKEAFAGTGNDFVLGGTGMDFLLGNEGDDWLEGGQRFDTLAGENSELFFNSSIIGHDIMNGGSGDTDYDGESGDDIMFQNNEGIQRSNGMAGFDWAIHKGDSHAANSDLGIPIFTTQEAFILRDRFDLVEGLSGWHHDDVLTGRSKAVNTRAELEGTAAIPGPNAILDSYSNDLLQKNVALIDGLAQLVAHLDRQTVTVAGKTEQIVMKTGEAADILLGGGGSDVIKGLAGNDIIDGDRWLNVRIEVTPREGQAWSTFSVDSMAEISARMLTGEIKVSQLSMVRELLDGDLANEEVDVAVYTDVVANYTFTRNADGSITVDHTGFTDPGDGEDENGEDIPEETVQNRLLSDGVDRLFNIERLRFSDGNGGTIEYSVDQLVNSLPTGAPTISDMTPTEGQTLTASPGTIADVDGIASGFTYQWQMSTDGGATWTDTFDNLQGNSDATFNPNEGIFGFGSQVGNILRVAVSFTDGKGREETVYSAPTGVVGDDWDRGLLTGDTFNGTAGDDHATGGDVFRVVFFDIPVSDTLNGNAGDDTLIGRRGDDVLNGGEGDDILDGGGNTDVAIFTGAMGNFSLIHNGTTITVTDNTGAEGVDILTSIEDIRFNGVNYDVVTGGNQNNANLNGANGTNNSQAVFGLNGNDTINGGAGNDYIDAGAGNDTITQTGNTGGRDFIDGGADTDTYQLNGANGAETFTIYSRAAAQATIAGVALAASTEIVIARNGVVIAELDNIEEIRVNALQVTSPAGDEGGVNGGDTIQVVGDFTGTSLSFSTIAIDGAEGSDVVDISSLSSAHRVVFRSNGGNDTIIGTLRSQDVIELPAGSNLDDYEATDNENGTTTMSDGSYSVTYATAGAPQFAIADHDDDDHDDGDDDANTGDDDDAGGDDDHDDDHGDDDDHDDNDDDADDDDGAGGSCDDHDDDAVVAPPVVGSSNIGTPQADALVGSMGDDVLIGLAGDDSLLGGDGADAIHGGDGHDIVHGENGRDVVFAGAGNDDVLGGAGADMLYGDAGSDRILGGNGDDLINAGAGTDTVFGGAGDDIVVAETGDGDDTYYGDDMAGGTGTDTLDMAAIAANITADLGTGFMGRGSVFSADTGTDTIWGFENFVGGRGNDTVTAGNGVNVMDGGAGGTDTFRFLSASDANGDTILGFQPGDRIDLSMADGNACDAGKQSFELVTGEGFTDRGQLMVSHEVRDDGDYTIVHLNTSGGNAADYKFSIKGNHVLNESDFNL